MNDSNQSDDYADDDFAPPVWLVIGMVISGGLMVAVVFASWMGWVQ